MLKVLGIAFLCLLTGCKSRTSLSSAHLAEFVVPGHSAGPITSKSDAEAVASVYRGSFDESGSIEFKSESKGSWVFRAYAGDFTAVPVADIVIRKDGILISQGKVGPKVRLVGRSWMYDEQEVNPLLRSLLHDDAK